MTRGRGARRGDHVSVLRRRRGGPDRARGRRRQESRGVLPTIGRQLLGRGPIDEIDLHIAPVLLGDGIRLFDNPGGEPVYLDLVNADDPTAAVNVRYRPAAR